MGCSSSTPMEPMPPPEPRPPPPLPDVALGDQKVCFFTHWERNREETKALVLQIAEELATNETCEKLFLDGALVRTVDCGLDSFGSPLSVAKRAH